MSGRLHLLEFQRTRLQWDVYGSQNLLEVETDESEQMSRVRLSS
jgi:hypothetical protein